jgi:uncharacterized Rmd1/YagE family protein
MRCEIFCLANTLHIDKLLAFLKAKGRMVQMYRDVLHVQLEEEGSGTFRDLFYFSFGAITCWGMTEEEKESAKQLALEYADHPLTTFEYDEFDITLGDRPRIHNDRIWIPDYSPLTRLGISYGLAQSVKLEAFERTIRETIESTRSIPNELATKGRILLSSREIRRKMGELFLERSSINLYFDVLDTPELIWDYPELESLYHMTALYLDIEARVEVLNQRLSIVHELFEMLDNELKYKHSSKLEWVIILLIMAEVILTLARDVFKFI